LDLGDVRHLAKQSFERYRALRGIGLTDRVAITHSYRKLELRERGLIAEKVAELGKQLILQKD
jgi:hypothetical protein